MAKINLLIDDEEFWVEGEDFEALLDVVKAIPGRKFDPEERVWSVAGPPKKVAAVIRPHRLMWVDADDPVGDSRPLQIHP